MFVSSRLVYTELHKTGGTHIGKLLKQLVGGEQVGKHNRMPEELWNRFLIGSIRNPWDWYVSLWAYGCGGQGSVYLQTTRRFDLRYLNRHLHAEMGLDRTSFVKSGRQLWHDTFKPVASWQAAYADYSNADAFRRWLSLLFDNRRRFDVREGYGFSPLSENFGLMTYRFFKLYSRVGKNLYRDHSLMTLRGLEEVWNKEKLVSYVIRNESLEHDFISALEQAGCNLSEEERESVTEGAKRKTNVSKRLPAGFYYDHDTLNIVGKREEMIIKYFNYEPPEVIVSTPAVSEILS